MPMDTVLSLIRHCQTTGREPDAPPTPTGRRQAETLADRLADARIDRIVSSPFARARRSASPLARRLRLPIETDPRWRERTLGVRAGPD